MPESKKQVLSMAKELCTEKGSTNPVGSKELKLKDSILIKVYASGDTRIFYQFAGASDYQLVFGDIAGDASIPKNAMIPVSWVSEQIASVSVGESVKKPAKVAPPQPQSSSEEEPDISAIVLSRSGTKLPLDDLRNLIFPLPFPAPDCCPWRLLENPNPTLNSLSLSSEEFISVFLPTLSSSLDMACKQSSFLAF